MKKVCEQRYLCEWLAFSLGCMRGATALFEERLFR